MRRATTFVLLLTLCSCANFSAQMYRGLTVSQAGWQQLMNAVDRAESEGKITPGAARVILTYEERYRTTHNQIAALTAQWVELKAIAANEDQLRTLKARIIAFQVALAQTIAEFSGFLTEMGVLDANPFRRPTAAN